MKFGTQLRRTERAALYCPRCGGSSHHSGSNRGEPRFRCNQCRTYFQMSKAVRPVRSINGSGQIAERITIGRGSVWGARIRDRKA